MTADQMNLTGDDKLKIINATMNVKHDFLNGSSENEEPSKLDLRYFLKRLVLRKI